MLAGQVALAVQLSASQRKVGVHSVSGFAQGLLGPHSGTHAPPEQTPLAQPLVATHATQLLRPGPDAQCGTPLGQSVSATQAVHIRTCIEMLSMDAQTGAAAGQSADVAHCAHAPLKQ